MIKNGSFKYDNGVFEFGDDGVRFVIERLNRNDELIKSEIFVCGPLVVLAASRSKDQNGWGRLLYWKDGDDKEHKLAIPMTVFQSDGRLLREILSDGGLIFGVSQKQRALLLSYIINFPISDKVWCTDRVGWNGSAYVFPDKCIGDEVIYQGDPSSLWMKEKGSINEWIEGVSKLCDGNSRLVLVISLALCGPLLKKIDHENFGINLFGRSSIGKTTAAKVAFSIYGDPREIRSWLTTSNGVEAMAIDHNDSMLVIDELGQGDIMQIAKAAYTLANGTGKSRATINGKSKATNKWRLTFLVTGEQTLGDLKAQQGMKINVGEEVRLLDMPADSGKSKGLFEYLHGYDAEVFASLLTANSNKNFGAVGYAWIKSIANDNTIGIEVCRLAKSYQSLFSLNDLSSSVHLRVARHIALLAAVGEVATKLGLTGWRSGVSLQSALQCFFAWKKVFGEGIKEEVNIIKSVKSYLLKYGSTRFEVLPKSGNSEIYDRVGYKIINSDESIKYYIFDQELKEIAGNPDIHLIRKSLNNIGLLTAGGDGRLTRKERLPGFSYTQRFNVLIM